MKSIAGSIAGTVPLLTLYSAQYRSSATIGKRSFVLINQKMLCTGDRSCLTTGYLVNSVLRGIELEGSRSTSWGTMILVTLPSVCRGMVRLASQAFGQ
jgi:hypothetical protein